MPYRMLIGHSFGGITAIHALLHHTHLFNSYVSIDPSMWWSDQQLLKEIAAKKDTSINTQHFRKILELGEHLTTYPNGLQFKYKYYPDDDHGSVPLITEYDALRFVFKNYRFSFDMEDMINEEVDIAKKIEQHYQQLTKEFGYTIKPDEQLINQLGYQFLQMEQLDRAERFFNLNVNNYPNSSNVYDSLGDFYLATDKKAKARKNFKKALSIQETEYTRDKLNNLKE